MKTKRKMHPAFVEELHDPYEGPCQTVAVAWCHATRKGGRPWTTSYLSASDNSEHMRQRAVEFLNHHCDAEHVL